MASLDNTFVYSPSFLTDDDIPGSSLNGRNPNQLKNSVNIGIVALDASLSCYWTQIV